VPFLQARSAVAEKDAAARCLRRRMGVVPGCRRAYLWGAAQDAPSAGRGLVRRLGNRVLARVLHRELYLPATGLEDARLDDYVERLRRFRPGFLQGYPSATDLLARRILARGDAVPIPTVILTAEPVFPDQRERVARAFSAKVLAFYGARECGWIAAECATAGRLHVNTAGVHVEATPDGRLLVTDLVNRAMPLLRYEIGDRGRIDLEPCRCGDPRPVLASLEGRQTDVFVLPSGRRVPGVVTDLRGYRAGEGILDVQLVQDEPGALDVHWVPTAAFRPEDMEALRARLDRWFFGEVELRFHRRDRIAPGPNGKVRWCVSRVAG
jgi:phenylacetate-CoA ligase